jgi:hypothetical protein
VTSGGRNRLGSPLRVEHHGAALGKAVHLHRTHGGSLWGETESEEGEAGVHVDTIVTGAALVERSAQTGIEPARFLPGRLDYPEVRRGWKLSDLERHIVETAAATVRKCGSYSRDPLELFDDAPPEVVLRRRSLDTLHSLEQIQLMEDEQMRPRQQLREKLRLRTH